MPTRIFYDFLNPDDLQLCKRVFESACAELGMDGSSLDSHIVASAVLSIFQTGLRDEAGLLTAVLGAQRDGRF
jgi:hypothetical protein